MGYEEVARTFRSQHEVIHRHQALAAGLTSKQIETRLTNGKWIRLGNGIYTDPAIRPTWRRQLSAALLECPTAIVGGRSAAHLHGFSDLGVGRPELLAPFVANARSRFARVIRSRHFDLVSRSNKEGFECSSPAETILTLSLTHPARYIEKLLDKELARRSLTVDQFNPIFERLLQARQPGLKPLRRIVGARASDAYQPPTSELETLLYAILDLPRMPAYQRQLPINYPTMRATVDAYIPEWRMIVEADGRRWHTTREHFEVDRERDNAALAQGLVVARFTWNKLRYHPDEVTSTLLAIGKQRSAA